MCQNAVLCGNGLTCLGLQVLNIVFNSLPNNNILDVTKLKAVVDNKLNGAEMMIFLCNRVENTVGKGENTDNQHFLLFPQCFPKPSSSGLLKVGIVW